ncbi:unnamed protein product [Mesocestoides corti]|uniref:Uncharacterized protein n=2 Tax=Mesocestoides corti TaxID=53468 RepID=A0A0R3UFT2_MESCO|nr:unnamed protein product [Mesocestoides corti]
MAKVIIYFLKRKEHCQQPVDSSGGEKDVTKGGGCNRLRNGLATVPSESTSCMDATAMATWGGDSERDDNDIEDDDDDAVAGEEFIEDVPSVVSSRSSRANKRFVTASSCSDIFVVPLMQAYASNASDE